jgi:hypothetical protein
MAIYTFYFRDARGSITSFDFIELGSDEEAAACARVLLSRRDLARSVEIVEGQRMLSIGAALRLDKPTSAACGGEGAGA